MDMNISTFKDLGNKSLLGKLICENGQRMKNSKFSLKFDHIFPIVFLPEGLPIDVIDLIIFGSMVYPKKIKKEIGLIFKRTIEEIEIPQDIDIAVITKEYSSKFLEKATIVSTYDLGNWLQSPGIDLAHIPKFRISEDCTISKSIKKGISLFSDRVEWGWDKGRINCYL